MEKPDRGAIEARRNGIERRSPKWPEVEKAHLKIQPRCACCTPGMDPGAGVQVHHIFPFHYCIALRRPDLELDDRNLITLCEKEEGRPGEDHHLLVGHLDSFQSSNLAVVKDAQQTYHGWSGGKIKVDPGWLKEVQGRLKPLDKMTQADKDSFAALMNKTLPTP